MLYSFQGNYDDSTPLDRLLNYNGILYGTTNDSGTVFSFNPKTGTETVLHNFFGGADGLDPVAGLINMHGTLYGTTLYGGGNGCGGEGCGTVFAVDPESGAETVLYSFQDNGSDGTWPAGLVEVKGVLYGTTEFGGTNNAGTIFKISP